MPSSKPFVNPETLAAVTASAAAAETVRKDQVNAQSRVRHLPESNHCFKGRTGEVCCVPHPCPQGSCLSEDPPEETSFYLFYQWLMPALTIQILRGLSALGPLLSPCIARSEDPMVLSFQVSLWYHRRLANLPAEVHGMRYFYGVVLSVSNCRLESLIESLIVMSSPDNDLRLVST